MKKYFIITAFIMAFHAIYGISDKEIVKELELSAWQYQESFDPTAFYHWNKVFDKAKIFVLNKSKNFFGTQDAAIVGAMDMLEEWAHNRIAYLVSRGKPVAPYDMQECKRILNDILGKITEALNIMAKSNKTESKNVMIALALCLTKFAQQLSRELLVK